MDTSLVTAFVLAETLFDDKAEEHRDLRDLVLPLLLCSCLDAAQQTQAGAQAAAGAGKLAAYGNRGEQQHVADATAAAVTSNEEIGTDTSALGSEELETEVTSVPPEDGGAEAEAGAAEDG
jgi:hypothetical protein